MKLSSSPPPPEPTGNTELISTESTQLIEKPLEPMPTVDPLLEVPTAPVKPSANWPQWFGPIDGIQVVLALVVTLFVASFTARNSDFWLHVGTGRMLAHGEYTLGSDPLSYSAVDRPWVNPSWLYDLACYLLYRGDGAMLVALKAILVVISLGLLIGMRRSGDALWPWAMMTGVAAIASAPELELKPTIASFFLLACTLFVLFRLPIRPGSYVLPIAIGVIFWLWASLDAWFVLGPFTIALLLLGELMRTRLFEPGETSSETGAFGSLHSARTLAIMLIIGIVACTLTPHHIRIWQIPYELATSSVGNSDFSLKVHSISPFTSFYWQQETLGFNINGLAFGMLLLVGIFVSSLCVLLGLEPLPIPLALLWAGFAALSLFTITAIPFFAVVTVPLAASRFNLLSNRLKLGPRSELNTRLLLTASVAGRFLTLILLLVLGAAAWPGWLQPPESAWISSTSTSQAVPRMVNWKIEPDTAMVRAAEQIQTWRTRGELPNDVHGIIASIELANYCAWFAPSEKVFLNGRLNHHRREMQDFVTIRAALNIVKLPEPPPADAARRIFEKRGFDYLGMGGDASETIEQRYNQLSVELQIASLGQKWSLWYLGGRVALLGWRDSYETAKPEFTQLKIDPAELAFGPGVEKLKPGKLSPPGQSKNWTDAFTKQPATMPPEIDEALAWVNYKDTLKGLYSQKLRQIVPLQAFLLQNLPRLNPLPLPADLVFGGYLEAEERLRKDFGDQWNRPWPERSALASIPFLALRAARRAVAANPDHPDAYLALAKAYSDSDLPMSDGERSIGILTAYKQCLERIPPPSHYRSGMFYSSGYGISHQLARWYLGARLPGQFLGNRVDAHFLADIIKADYLFEEANSRQPRRVRIPPGPEARRRAQAGDRELPGRYIQALDVAAQYFKLASEYAPIDLERAEDAQKAKELKSVEEERKVVETELRAASERYNSSATNQTKLRDRYAMARQLGLIGRAIELLNSNDVAKEFGPDAPLVLIEKIGLELAIGRLEEAASDLGGLSGELNDLEGKIEPQRLEFIRTQLRHIDYIKLILEGDYAAAGDAQETFEGRVASQIIPSPKALIGFSLQFLAVPPNISFPASIVAPGNIAFSYLRELVFVQARQSVMAQMQQSVTFFYRRGLLSLYEGDIAAAKTRFQQCAIPGQPEWLIIPFNHLQARDYLRLIDMAEKKAASR